MPQTELRVFRQSDGKVLLTGWRKELLKKNKRAYAKSLERMLRLEQHGSELGPPLAKLLRDGIYELRVRSGNEQHRILYFFSGQDVAVLSHGLQKESAVPAEEIQRAMSNHALVKKNVSKHTMTLEDWRDSLDD